MASDQAGSASQSTAPDPESASTAADFVAQMRAVRQWSGLTMRQVSARARAAGNVLPYSTLATALSRTSLPREELVAAFIRACVDDPETVRRWILVRKRIAVATAGSPASGDVAAADESSNDPRPVGAIPGAHADGPRPSRDDPPIAPADPVANQDRARSSSPSGKVDAAPTGSVGLRAMFSPLAYRTRWASRVLLGLLMLLSVAVAARVLVSTLRSTGAGTALTTGDPSAVSTSQARSTGSAPATTAHTSSSVGAAPGAMPEPGTYRMMPLATYDSTYCVAAGREPSGSRRGDVAVLSTCASAVPASSELRMVAATTYQIYWADPAGGGGCLQVDRVEHGEPAAAFVYLLAPHDYCSQPDQRFIFEPVVTKYGTGYRLHPETAPELCIGTLAGGTAKGTAIAQVACTGRDTEVFVFKAV